jgi:hypothetical protein
VLVAQEFQRPVKIPGYFYIMFEKSSVKYCQEALSIDFSQANLIWQGWTCSPRCETVDGWILHIT